MGQGSFGVRVRCVWQATCLSLGWAPSLILACQSVIGIWMSASNNNLILAASCCENYSNRHNSISSDLLVFITHFSCFLIFRNECTVGCQRRWSWCVIKSHSIWCGCFIIILSAWDKHIKGKCIFFGHQIPEQA